MSLLFIIIYSVLMGICLLGVSILFITDIMTGDFDKYITLIARDLFECSKCNKRKKTNEKL